MRLPRLDLRRHAASVVRIPQYDAEPRDPGRLLHAGLPLRGASYGYAWVALEEPIAPIPDMPEFDAPGWRTIFQFYERWATSPLRALENSFDNSHFSFVHRATFGVAAQPKPSRYELVENDTGFYAETVIAAANPPAFHRVSGSSEPITRATCATPTTCRSRAGWTSSTPAACATSSSTASRPSTTATSSCANGCSATTPRPTAPSAMLIDFDHVITREDKDILESTDPDALVDTRRRGVEYSMDSDRPGMLIRKQLMELLARHGEAEVHRGTATMPG